MVGVSLEVKLSELQPFRLLSASVSRHAATAPPSALMSRGRRRSRCQGARVANQFDSGRKFQHWRKQRGPYRQLRHRQHSNHEYMAE